MWNGRSGDRPAGYDPMELVRQLRFGVPREQLARLARQTPINTAVTISVVALILIFALPEVAIPGLVYWGVAHSLFVGVNFVRWRTSQEHAEPTRTMDMSPTRSGLYHAMVWAGVSGALWGGLTIFLSDKPPHIQFMLIISIAGMAAGASGTLAAVPQVAIVFILGCMLPLIGSFFAAGDSISLYMGLAFSIFMVAMIGTAQVVYASLLQQMRVEDQAKRFRETRLQHRIAEATSTAESFDEVIRFCLTELCKYMNWPAGHVFIRSTDDSDKLIDSGIWYVEDRERFEDLISLTKTVSFRSGKGFPGEVMKARKPIWLNRETARDPEFDASQNPRHEVMLATGAQAILGLPVIVGSEVMAILELISDQEDAPDQHTVELMESAAAQTGRAIERHWSNLHLRQSEQKFRALIDQSAQAIAVYDEDEALFVNEQGAAMFGYTVREFLALDSIFDIVHPDDRKRMRIATDRRHALHQGPTTFEFKGQHRSGRVLWLLARASLIDWDGRDAILVTVIDLTERKRAEESAREQEERAQRYLEIAASVIYGTSADENIAVINRAGCQFLQCTEAEAVGANWFDTFVPEDERESRRNAFHKWMSGEVEIPRHRESRILTKSGEIRLARWEIAPLYDDDGQPIGILTSGHDITDQRRIEEQLHQAQKMEAVGQLTSGIAHDFNNILAVIMGNLEIAQENLEAGVDVGKMLKAAMHGAQRGADLNRKLLTFSKQQVFDEQVRDVNATILNVEEIINRTLGESISVRTNVCAQRCLAKLDPAQLESAILNLAINARDAMPAGGKLTIETSLLQPEHFPGFNQAAGPMIHILVSDSGMGMSAEVRERALEPFFTTKESQGGTGLGLSMVFAFAKQAGGHMEIDSTLGAGTDIHLFLPLSADAAGRPEKRRAVSTDKLANAGTVLVVEDQDEVREVVTAYLHDLGYEVIEAPDGPSALRIIESAEAEFSFVLSDMVMPGGIDGTDVIAGAQRAMPGIRSVLMSGNPNLSDEDRPAGLEGLRLLRKPFRKAELARALRHREG